MASITSLQIKENSIDIPQTTFSTIYDTSDSENIQFYTIYQGTELGQVKVSLKPYLPEGKNLLVSFEIQCESEYNTTISAKTTSSPYKLIFSKTPDGASTQNFQVPMKSSERYLYIKTESTNAPSVLTIKVTGFTEINTISNFTVDTTKIFKPFNFVVSASGNTSGYGDIVGEFDFYSGDKRFYVAGIYGVSKSDIYFLLSLDSSKSIVGKSLSRGYDDGIISSADPGVVFDHTIDYEEDVVLRVQVNKDMCSGWHGMALLKDTTSLCYGTGTFTISGGGRTPLSSKANTVYTLSSSSANITKVKFKNYDPQYTAYRSQGISVTYKGENLYNRSGLGNTDIEIDLN